MAGPIGRAPACEVAAGQFAAHVVGGDAEAAGEQIGAEAGNRDVGRTVRTNLVWVAPAAGPGDPHGTGGHAGVVEVTGDPHPCRPGARRHQPTYTGSSADRLLAGRRRWPFGRAGAPCVRRHRSATDADRPPDRGVASGGRAAAEPGGRRFDRWTGPPTVAHGDTPTPPCKQASKIHLGDSCVASGRYSSGRR